MPLHSYAFKDGLHVSIFPISNSNFSTFLLKITENFKKFTATVLVINFVRVFQFQANLASFSIFADYSPLNFQLRQCRKTEKAGMLARQAALQCSRKGGFSSTDHLCALAVEETASLSVKSFGKALCASRCPLSRATVAGAEKTV